MSIVGTPLYQSPQMLRSKQYNETVDNWALGVILYELISGYTPFQSANMQELIRKINDGRYKVCQENGESIKIETCLFLLECLQSLESGRISIEDLLGHPFV